ncbi:unnamed protein product [Hymenolepis diminuta]|uniref:Uncharacterized protein n=1 Tax=Hymenolepis diminuta TaxID=6216 RepID=A0A564ZAD8_HYMDI|nr:unnamed protein product [Hymenolepis diminuta]
MSIFFMILIDSPLAAAKGPRDPERILSDPEFMEWVKSNFPNIAFLLAGKTQEPSTETVREVFKFMAELNNYYALYGRASNWGLDVIVGRCDLLDRARVGGVARYDVARTRFSYEVTLSWEKTRIDFRFGITI